MSSEESSIVRWLKKVYVQRKSSSTHSLTHSWEHVRTEGGSRLEVLTAHIQGDSGTVSPCWVGRHAAVVAGIIFLGAKYQQLSISRDLDKGQLLELESINTKTLRILFVIY